MLANVGVSLELGGQELLVTELSGSIKVRILDYSLLDIISFC